MSRQETVHILEHMLKEAGFFDGLKSWFSGFFKPTDPGTKEQKRALSRVDSHFKAKDKNWDRFVDNTRRKSFVKAISEDSRADDKLKRHVDSMNRLQTGKVLGTVQGTEGSRTAKRDGAQSYKIIKLRGSDRLGCTCRDWRFKKSVALPGEQVDCKHIRQFRQQKVASGRSAVIVKGNPKYVEGPHTNKTAAHPTYTAQLTSLSPQEQSKLLKEEAQKAKEYGRKDFWKDPRYRAEVSLKFPKLFPGKRSWRELTDQDFDKIVRHYRKCRTDRDRYMALRMELGALGLPKDVWRQKVRAVVGTLPVEQMNKTAADKAPRLTFITGGAGAGKSTMAKKLVDSGEFDILIGTDTGGVVNGQYVKPPKAEREKIRNRREALALKMRAKGKRVLVEGYPRGVLRYPKLLAQADDVLYLDTPMATRMFRVGKRSLERGTPMLPDLKMGLTTHFDDLKYRKEIEERSPNFRSIRTYAEAKKEAASAEYRPVSVGKDRILLDTSIPYVSRLPTDEDSLLATLRRNIEKAKPGRWSHSQIAIPASIDLERLKNAKQTRLAIPLPGESIGSLSTRIGQLHSHTMGPVRLVHLDESDPASGVLGAIRHIPETLAATKVRYIDRPAPFLKEAAEKLKVLYIDETGAGHRAQANNVVSAARKAGIDAEAVDFSKTFLKNKKVGKEYRDAFLDFLSKKSITTLPRLARAHLNYHGSVDPKKREKFLKENEDSALLLAHPHLEHQFSDLKRPISVMHTDPVKWPLSPPAFSKGKRLHIGTRGVVGDMPDESKVEVSGLAVHQELLKKRMPSSGLLNRKKFNVTVSAGGEALEVPEMVEQVLQADLPGNVEVHAVAGRRKDILKKLRQMAKKDPRLKPHGFAPLPKMMREADLNVIRAHGTSYAETLTSGKPAVYYGPSRQLIDFQGTMTRRTALYGGKETGFPIAVGLENIPNAVEEARRNYSGLRSKAKKLQKEYGDPGTQIALAATKYARAPRDYKREYEQYHSQQEQIDNRSLRNQARRKLGLPKGDPREVDHKTPLSKGGSNHKSNLSAVSRSTNRKKFDR